MIRKVGIRRGDRIKAQSKKRLALMDSVRDERVEYLRGRQCIIHLMKGYNVFNQATDVHEIIGGSFRQRTVKDKRFWLPVSRLDHDELQGMPKAKQWALKFTFDIANFDPDAIDEIPGFKVDAKDVLREIAKLRIGK